jgi:hypothetical protein
MQEFALRTHAGGGLPKHPQGVKSGAEVTKIRQENDVAVATLRSWRAGSQHLV